MTRMANEYERADHYRDLAKHDDTPPLYAQSAPIAGALEVAILAQAVPLQAAADLIEQYARTMAAGARMEATEIAISRCCEEIAKFGERSDA